MNKLIIITALFLILFSVNSLALEYEPNKVVLGKTTWQEPYDISEDLIINPSNNQTLVSHDQIAWCNNTHYSWGVGGKYQGSCELPSGFGNPTSIETEYITPTEHANQMFYISSDNSYYDIYDDLCRKYNRVTATGTNLDASHVHNPSDYDYVLYMLQDMGSNIYEVQKYSIVEGQYDYSSMSFNHSSIPLGIGYSQKIYAEDDNSFWLGQVSEGVGGSGVGRVIKCYNYASCVNKTYFCWDISKLFSCSREECSLNPNSCGLWVSDITSFPENYTLGDFQIMHKTDGDYIVMSVSSTVGGDNAHIYYKIIDDDICTGNYGECNNDLDCVQLCLNNTINTTYPYTCGQMGCNCSTHTCNLERANVKTNLTDTKYITKGLSDDNQIGIGKENSIYYVINDNLFYNYNKNSIANLKGAKYLDVFPRYRITTNSYYISKVIDMGTPVDFVSYDTDPSLEGAEINVSMRSSDDKVNWSDWYPVSEVPNNRYYQVKIVFGYEKTYPVDVEWSYLDKVTLYYFQRPKGSRGFANLQICPTLDGIPTTDFSAVLRHKEGEEPKTYMEVDTFNHTNSNCINFNNIEKGVYELTVFKLGARDKRSYNTWKENITLVEDKTIAPNLVSLPSNLKYNLSVTLYNNYTGNKIIDPNGVVYIEGYPIYQSAITNNIEISGLQTGVNYWAYAEAPNYSPQEFDTKRGLTNTINLYLNKINIPFTVTAVDDANIKLFGVNLDVYNETDDLILHTNFDETYIDYLKRGKYRFVLSKSGYLTAEQTINLIKETDITVNLHTEIGGSIGEMVKGFNETISGFFLGAEAQYSPTTRIIISFVIIIIVGAIGGIIGGKTGELTKSLYTSFGGIIVTIFFFSLIGWLPYYILIISIFFVGLIVAKVLIGVFFH